MDPPSTGDLRRWGALLTLRVENTVGLQQPTKNDWSNSTSPLNGGWPSYEFGDGSTGVSGIVRRGNGDPGIRLWMRSIASTPNRLAVEFQDSLNEYQQDSYSLVDVNDVQLTGQEITAPITALGLPNYDQAARILKFNLDKAIHGNTYVEFETSIKALGIEAGDIITLTYLKEGFNRQAFRVIKIAPGINYGTAVLTAQMHDDAWYDDTNGQVPGNSGARPQPTSGAGLPRPLIGLVVDSNGYVQFQVTESAVQAADGSQVLEATVQFAAPSTVSSSAPGVPLLSLAPTISSSGGTLSGGQSFYYAVSAIDGNGLESNLSFIVRATIAAGPATNSVTLAGLSFPSTTTAFDVYRGPNPSQLYRIASNQPIGSQFLDAGLQNQVIPPPDSNFDHANFYWRLELQPEFPATIYSATSVGNDTLEMAANAYLGMVVRITRGTGAGQERPISSNTTTTIQLGATWDAPPDGSSYFVVAESGWHFAASTKTSPVQFQIPNQAGATIHITGRAANVNDAESPVELSTVTRWVIGGAGAEDASVPPAPSFGIGLSGSTGGTIEVSGVSFTDLTNTHTTAAGTLALYYWSELDGATPYAISSTIQPQDTTVVFNGPGNAQPGSYVQLEGEVARVEAVSNNGSSYQVVRGADGTTASAHAAGTALYELKTKIQVIPFVHDFFGSPYSGSWSYPIYLPDCRIASAELFVTNIKGNGPTGSIFLTQTTDFGLRTLSGGQLSFQVEGFLAIETGATPDIIVENAHSVRDVYAVLRQATSGGPVQLQINQNNVPYCSLTIADGATVSNTVAGSTLPPLIAGARLSLDITMVGPTNPGSDLTVVIRL